jgi:serine/threonine protein phosphatase PrpC
VSLSTSVPEPERFVTGSLTDVGRVRSVNQDYCDEFNDAANGRRILIVADGMGGHRGGEIASQMAVEAAAGVFAAGGSDARQLLRRAFEAANLRVHKAAGENTELAGMGTTAVCLLFETGGSGWVAHVGDSRAYRLRADKLEPLTEDHSVVGALIRMGHITEEEARLHPQRNEILRAIGTNEDVEVQVTALQLQPGDRYLLCSDGLSGLVSDDEIREVLGSATPQAAVQSLVEMANLEGGSDNITVQIVAIPGEPLQEGETLELATTKPPEHEAMPRWLWITGGVLLAALGLLLLRGC